MTIIITSVTMPSKLKQAVKRTKGKKREKYAKNRYTEKREKYAKNSHTAKMARTKYKTQKEREKC